MLCNGGAIVGQEARLAIRKGQRASTFGDMVGDVVERGRNVSVESEPEIHRQ